MKQAALQALQHVRMMLAYQLTPEAVGDLLWPIERALNAEPFHPVQPVLTQTHNAKVDEAIALAEEVIENSYYLRADVEPFFESIRSLRL